MVISCAFIHFKNCMQSINCALTLFIWFVQYWKRWSRSWTGNEWSSRCKHVLRMLCKKEILRFNYKKYTEICQNLKRDEFEVLLKENSAQHVNLKKVSRWTVDLFEWDNGKEKNKGKEFDSGFCCPCCKYDAANSHGDVIGRSFIYGIFSKPVSFWLSLVSPDTTHSLSDQKFKQFLLCWAHHLAERWCKVIYTWEYILKTD